jgi:hypothetical protein
MLEDVFVVSDFYPQFLIADLKIFDIHNHILYNDVVMAHYTIEFITL